MGGWFYGVTRGLGVKNIYLRREQFRLADDPDSGALRRMELGGRPFRDSRVAAPLKPNEDR